MAARASLSTLQKLPSPAPGVSGLPDVSAQNPPALRGRAGGGLASAAVAESAGSAFPEARGPRYDGP
jgi:hypothetical protein